MNGHPVGLNGSPVIHESFTCNLSDLHSTATLLCLHLFQEPPTFRVQPSIYKEVQLIAFAIMPSCFYGLNGSPLCIDSSG